MFYTIFLSVATTRSGLNWPPGSGSVIQNYGTKNPDPKTIFTEPPHFCQKPAVPVFVVGFLQVPDLGHSAAAPLHRQAPAACQHQVLHLCGP